MSHSKPRHWDSFFAFLLKWEGTTLENDPSDPGGLTKFGIDQRSHPRVDIASLTREQAEQIYLDEYSKSPALLLTSPLDLVFFDAEVNCGRTQAVRLLQRALGVKADGVYGPVTDRAVYSTSTVSLIAKMIAQREAFYTTLAKNKLALGKFLKGWLNRTADLRKWVGGHL